MSNSLDPDQDLRFVHPDLSSNCLQRLSADICETTKGTISKERVTVDIEQEGHSGPESLTCRFYTFPLISLCKTIDPRIRAIFGPRAII